MLNLLLLPGDPGFEEILGAALPPGWQQIAASTDEGLFVVQPGSAGLLTPVNHRELEEYLEGGEYETRLSEIEASEDVAYNR